MSDCSGLSPPALGAGALYQSALSSFDPEFNPYQSLQSEQYSWPWPDPQGHPYWDNTLGRAIEGALLH
ncbi:MAG: hypothetical protein HC796_09420 [Synechococcaceae cyanobacterium RL_1_2]|nr:hypothetical protein [Synechococcaceae cyanobacterium RL_1_2]